MLLVGTVALPVGCGGSSDKNPADSTIAKGGSQATGTPGGKTVSTVVPPNEIVAMFADSVRRGDKETMAKLITTAARAEIQRRGITIDPPGSPEASYKLGEVRFLDEDKDAAYVESVWIEPPQDGQPAIQTEVVWAVTLEDQGWRISGLAIDMGADQPATIVDFEDLQEAVVEDPQSAGKIANAAPADGQAPVQQVPNNQFAPVNQQQTQQTQFAPVNNNVTGFAPANSNFGNQPVNDNPASNGFAPVNGNQNAPQLSQPANTQILR